MRCMMRLSLSLTAVVALSVVQTASAQDWVEFSSRQDQFTITFPAQPAVSATTYKTASGSVLPARLYEAASGKSRYSVLVADFNNIEAIAAEKAKACPPGAETCSGGRAAGSATGVGYWKADLAGAVTYATWQFFLRDAKVTYMGWNSADLVEGNMLSITNKDQSRTSAAVYMHENKLFILEGTVPAGFPDPGFFQQSVGWLDENGIGIRYQTLYHNGFPKPTATRGTPDQAGPAR